MKRHMLTTAALLSFGLCGALPAQAQEKQAEQKDAIRAVQISPDTSAPAVSAPRGPSDAPAEQKVPDHDMVSADRPAGGDQVEYVSGGVADSGMTAIDMREHNYNLKMLFVSEGAYLSDITVDIKDGKGKSIVSTTTKGPALLARLPPGHYKAITTAAHGSQITQDVEVGTGHLASYTLRYPAKEMN